MTAQLDREGVPYDVVKLADANRPKITAAFLADGTTRAKYQGVVMPNENALPADELAALAPFEKQFGVRQVDAYTWANPANGRPRRGAARSTAST